MAQQRGPRRRKRARPGSEEDHADIDCRVERDRDRAESDELQPHRARRRIDELRQERQEEGRRLRVQGFYDDAVAEGAGRAGAGDRRRRHAVAFSNRLEPEPDQIERARDLEQRKRLGTRHDQRRDTGGAGQDMHEAADPGADARRQAFAAATGQRARGDIEDAGTRRQRDQRGRQQEKQEAHAREGRVRRAVRARPAAAASRRR